MRPLGYTGDPSPEGEVGEAQTWVPKSRLLSVLFRCRGTFPRPPFESEKIQQGRLCGGLVSTVGPLCEGCSSQAF